MNRRFILPTLVGLACIAPPGCSGEEERSRPGRPVSVYFLRDGRVAAARRAVDTATVRAPSAALLALLEGPNEDERSAGLSSALPADAELIDLATRRGTTRVRLSPEFLPANDRRLLRRRIAQVVYTLTQFPGVSRVRLEVQSTNAQGGLGRVHRIQGAETRRELEQLTPVIFLESPVVGDRVQSPIHLRGTANTFEANFTIRVLDRDGRMLREHFVTATSGTGTRGTFEVRFPVPGDYEGPIELLVFEPSAADGSELFPVRVPLTLVR